MSGPQSHYRFDGATLAEQGADADARLLAQWERVHDVMVRAGVLDLTAIAERCGDPEASISARLRDLRKPRFHAHEVRRTHLGDGHYAYSVLPTARCPRCQSLIDPQMRMEVA